MSKIPNPSHALKDLSHSTASFRLTKATAALPEARKACARADAAHLAATAHLLDVEHPEWREEICKASRAHDAPCTNEACRAKFGDWEPSEQMLERAKRAQRVARENWKWREEQLGRAERELVEAKRGWWEIHGHGDGLEGEW